MRQMDGIDPGRLAEALARRFNAVLPSGIQVKKRDRASLLLLARGKVWSITDLKEDLENETPGLEGVLLNFLSHVQDFVAEECSCPWPRLDHTRRLPGEDLFPAYGVIVTNDRLRLLYGAPEAPYLELEPIDMNELRA